MFELLPAWTLIVGLIVVCRLYLRAFRDLDRAAEDPAGGAVLTRQERMAIRELEHEFARASGGELVRRSNNN